RHHSPPPNRNASAYPWSRGNQRRAAPRCGDPGPAGVVRSDIGRHHADAALARSRPRRSVECCKALIKAAFALPSSPPFPNVAAAFFMKLSVVIPCYNELKTIRAIIDAVRAAPVPDKEIIVVDDCSTDGTRDL